MGYFWNVDYFDWAPNQRLDEAIEIDDPTQTKKKQMAAKNGAVSYRLRKNRLLFWDLFNINRQNNKQFSFNKKKEKKFNEDGDVEIAELGIPPLQKKKKLFGISVKN